MVNTHKIELPLSRTYFQSPEAVRAIEVRLYVLQVFQQDLVFNPFLPGNP